VDSQDSSAQSVIPPGANVSRTSITLVTGQTITVVEFGNETRYRVDADVPMQQVETPRGTYIFPAETDFGTFDRDLFNVDLLLEQGLTDEESEAIPVIVTQRSEAAGGMATLDTGDNDSRPGVAASFAQGVGDARGLQTERVLGSVGALSVDVSKGEARTAFDRLAEDSDVGRVYLDKRVHVTLDDVEGLVSAGQARNRFDVSGEGVTVAVLDTGVDDTHPDIQGSVVDEKDFTGEGTVEDGHGHGTHVAGIITGDGTASDGQYVGMAPDASIMNLRVIGSDGYGSTSDIIDAMEYADTNGADVISMSLGGDTSTNDPFFDAVQKVTASGTAVIVAAGNSGSSYETIKSPGVVPEAITVGASDDYDGITSFSSRGPTPIRDYVKPDLVAPGSYVYSAQAGTDGYVAKSGTSMATPVVSGVAALALQEHPGWTPSQLKSALVTTTDDVGSYDVYTAGAGRLNATAAVDPTLLVTDATTNVGNLSDDGTVTETLRVTNVGSQSRTVDVSATATSLDGDSGHVSVNKTTVTVDPGETVHLGLQVTADTANGLYSGRVQFDGGRPTAIFGYRVSGQSTLTVDKAAVNATDVGGDAVYLVQHDTGATELASLTATDSTGDAATADFPVTDGTYTVYTAGVDESTGQPILMSRTISISGDSTITFDESTTVKYRLDASEARTADGPLATLDLVGRLGTTVNGDGVHYQIRESFAGTTTVRFGTTTEQTASVAHLLAPVDRYPNGERHLDTPVAYHLLQSTDGVDGSETFVLDRSALARQSVTYYRSSDGQTYDVAREVRSDVIDGAIGTGEWSLRDRVDQTLYVSPAGTDGVDSRFAVTASDDSWSYTGNDWLTVASGAESTVGINQPPLTGTGSATVGSFDLTANVTMLVNARVEQGATRDVRSSTASTDYTVRRDGSILGEGTTSDDYVYFTDDDALPDGTVYELVTESGNTGQPLSTTTRNELQVTYTDGGDNDPPSVESVTTSAVAPNGTLPAGEVAVDVEVADNRLSEVTVLVRVADGSVTATPYDGAVADTSSEWQEATVTVVDESAGTYRATVDTSQFADGTMNLEVAVVDAGGNAMSTAAYDAYRVGASTGDESPSASFSTNLSSITVGDAVEFDAAGSSDDDGIAGYDWAFGDGTTATGQTVSHAYDAPGEYTVTLTVTDTAGQTDTDTATLTVEDRTAPSATLTANRTTAGIDDPVGFDAADSSDNHAIAEYRWDFDGDGTVDRTTTAATVDYAYGTAGTYDATVTVVDESGNTDTASVSVTVEDQTAPTADVVANATSVETGEVVAFDGSGSTDNVGVTSYEWAFGDGTTATGEQVTHSFSAEGSYTVTLTVTDGAGNSDTASVTVDVSADSPPTADVSASATAVAIDESVGFDASGSSDDDAISSYEWHFGDGTTGTGETVTHAYESPGEYTVTLRVTDTAGQTDTATTTITIEDRTAPSAALTANRTTVGIDGSVGFDASDSTDNVGIVEYRWDFDGDGVVDRTTTDDTTARGFGTPGTYATTVTVVDEAGNTDSASVSVTVEDQTAPTAEATVNTTSVEIGETVAFDGSGSTDNRGIASYEWAFGEGSAATGEQVTHTYASVGTYTVTLTVTDDAGNADTATVTVDVSADSPPSAALSASPTTVALEESVTFDASDSSDDDGIVEYRWDVDGDGSIDATTTTATTSHAFDATGIYDATVTVVDEAGNADSASVSVTVEDQTAPSADVVANATSVETGEAVAFDGSGSTDNVGVASYEWAFGDGTTETGEESSHSFSAEGTYEVTLTVTDAAGNTDTATVTVDVTADSAPTADLSANATSVSLDEPIEFDASASSDDDGIASYDWTFGDGATATGQTVSHAYDAPGDYTVTLTVTDTAGQTDTATTRISVEDQTAPSAALTANTTIAGLGDTVAFDASESTDDVGIAEYRWDFDGDGTVDRTTTAATADYAYAATGTYDATVTVVDEAGNSDAASVSVTVEDRTAPSAAATANATTVEIGEALAFDGSDSTDNVAIASYEWTFGDGSTATGQQAAHAYASEGTYTVTLTVTDQAGNSDTATLTVEVTADAPPAAALSASPTTVALEETVEFDASGSTDDDGIVEYRWDFDGDGAIDRTGSTPTTTDAYGTTGSFDATVTVVDESGNTDTASVTVTAEDRTAPTADVVANATSVEIGEAVAFDGSGSTDNVDIASYEWAFDDGTAATGAQASHAWNSAGNYTVRLTVTDAAGNVDTATVAVEVTADAAPTASFVANETSVAIEESVGFDAAGSTDDEGIQRYEWTFGDGKTATGESVTHAYAGEGTYTVTLTVTDTAGQIDTTTTTVTVEDRTAPTAALAANATTTGLDDPVAFDASQSTDNVAIAEYRWDVDGDGSIDATTAASGADHAYGRPGTYDAAVTVVDESGNTDTASVTITVEDRTAPSASFDRNRSNVTVGTAIEFDASESGDNVGVSSYEWDFGDGSTATGEQVTHAYAAEGNYTVTLTVTDAAGNVGTASADVSVRNDTTSDAPPTAHLVAAQSKVEAGAPIQFDATGSDDDAGIVEYRWDFDGDGAVDRVTTDSVVTTVYDEKGSTHPAVIVVDEAGQTDTASVKINVVGNRPPSASAKTSPSTARPDSSITFDASPTTDNGDVASYEWTFDDGTTATGKAVAHAYQEPGDYTVTLTVTDAAGNADTTTVTVSVESESNDGSGGDGDDDAGGGSGGGGAGGSDGGSGGDSGGAGGSDGSNSGSGADDSGTDNSSDDSNDGDQASDNADEKTAEETPAVASTPSANGLTLEVHNAGDGEQVRVRLNESLQQDGIAVNQLGIESEGGDSRFDVGVSHLSSTPVEGAPELDDAHALSYFSMAPTNLSTNASLAVDVRFSVGDSALPDGTAPSNLSLYHYDGTRWEALPTSYDPANESYVATVTSFSPFAIGVETPAEESSPALEPAFELVDSSLATGTVSAGENVTISATVRNDGDAPGTYRAILVVDDEAVAAESIEVAADATGTVTFEHAFENPGEYEVRLGETVVGDVTVESVDSTDGDGASTDGDGDGNPDEAVDRPGSRGTRTLVGQSIDRIVTSPLLGGGVFLLVAILLGAVVSRQ